MGEEFVGNKAKGQISKRVLQETKHATFSDKQKFLTPDTHMCACVLGGKKCSLFGKFGVLCFLVTPVLRFDFLPYCRGITKSHTHFCNPYFHHHQ